MKKILIFMVVAVLILSMGVIAFADTKDAVDVPQWFTEMIKWKKDQVKEAVDSNTITEEEAKLFNERIEYMEKFHEENGFNFPGGGFGGCGGRGLGGRGFGGGMRGNWNTPAAQNF